MIISYYLDKNSDQVLDNQYLVFKQIHEDEMFKSHYKRLKKEELNTNIFFINEQSKFQKKIRLSQLPAIELNNEIIKKKSFLTVKELSSILDIGITLQEKPD